MFNKNLSSDSLLAHYKMVRLFTHFLCEPLKTEDFVVQPTVDISPPKWHLAHTSWFFENFVLKPNDPQYKEFHPQYAYLFNSYYIYSGNRWQRNKRGQITRPTVEEIFEYRRYVDEHMEKFLSNSSISHSVSDTLTLGIHHEQQHQELFLYDIKRILGDNPIAPIYKTLVRPDPIASTKKWLAIDEGVYKIGCQESEFHFDNEKGTHKHFLHAFEISSSLVTNKEWIEFIEDKGYLSHELWFSEAWEWVNENQIGAPRYWERRDNEWWHYTLSGMEKVKMEEPVCHISYFEAAAFALWKNCRLPTEQEWEIACRTHEPEIPESSNFLEKKNFHPASTGNYDFYGNVWEWTASPYVAYPYFKTAKGALGEYNGKFMVNQMVLRGGSYATSTTHIRSSYRNFFHPTMRWLFSGLRLAKHI